MMDLAFENICSDPPSKISACFRISFLVKSSTFLQKAGK
jgi:hypothetical protein